MTTKKQNEVQAPESGEIKQAEAKPAEAKQAQAKGATYLAKLSPYVGAVREFICKNEALGWTADFTLNAHVDEEEGWAEVPRALYDYLAKTNEQLKESANKTAVDKYLLKTK